jgi:phosphoglycolate phosphatase
MRRFESSRPSQRGNHMPAGPRFDLVILDYDGTLCDTRRAIAHSIQRAFALQGRAIAAPAGIAPIVGQGLSLRDIFLSLDPDLSARSDAVDDLINTYRAIYRDQGESLIVMFSGAVAALRRLRAAQIKCAVLSNKGEAAVLRSLERCGLAPLIQVVFAEQPSRPGKPDPALLTDHIRPEFPEIARRRILMVGDTEVDIRFARQAGIACCWAAYGFGAQARCTALAPDYRIETIEELPSIVGVPADRTSVSRRVRRRTG